MIRLSASPFHDGRRWRQLRQLADAAAEATAGVLFLAATLWVWGPWL